MVTKKKWLLVSSVILLATGCQKDEPKKEIAPSTDMPMNTDQDAGGSCSSGACSSKAADLKVNDKNAESVLANPAPTTAVPAPAAVKAPETNQVPVK